MNDFGVDRVVLRSLDGEKMISNLDPGGLDLPSGSGTDVFLKLFDRSAGRLYWEGKLPTWEPDQEMESSYNLSLWWDEQEANEVDDMVNIAGEDEADCLSWRRPRMLIASLLSAEIA